MNCRNKSQWIESPRLVRKRAFGLLASLNDKNKQERVFMIGGLDLQSSIYVPEVEVLDSETKKWKFYRNLPVEVLNQHTPDAGCIGAIRNSIIFVGSSIISLNWSTWRVQTLSTVPAKSVNTKCTGNFK